MKPIHEYEKLARNALLRMPSLHIPYADRDECEREAVAAMCYYALKKPHLADNSRYMIAVGLGRIKSFLFGNHGKKNREILERRSQIDKVEGWLLKPDTKYQADDFIDRNLAKIQKLLLDIRKKKGSRGLSAASRDTQIIRLASLGWSNREISEEIGIPQDSVKKYRQSIVKKLKEVAP